MRIQELFKMVADRDIPELLDIPDPYGDGVVLNLGAGSKLFPGTVPLDLPEWNANTDPIPYPDGSVRGIHCYHLLEHVNDPILLLMECERVLVLGGVLNIGVPHYSAQVAFNDINHKHFFTEDTWRNLFYNGYYQASEYDFRMKVHANFLMGVAERNLMICTQMVKTLESQYPKARRQGNV